MHRQYGPAANTFLLKTIHIRPNVRSLECALHIP
jgi:hypothetical protein